MIDVFVRMAATPVLAGVVAESVRWAAGADPAAPRHQVVTLFGDPTVIHLAWALAAANRGKPDAVWRIGADGSAVAAEHGGGKRQLGSDGTAVCWGQNAFAHLRAESQRYGGVLGRQ